MNELKPCPFCGDEYVIAEISFSMQEFRIFCTGGDRCTAHMTLSFKDAGIVGSRIDFAEAYAIMEQLIEAWNRRADNG